jgi:hypothetical protein
LYEAALNDSPHSSEIHYQLALLYEDMLKELQSLFSIARKFYNLPARWKEIREANADKIDNPAKLTPGTEPMIP